MNEYFLSLAGEVIGMCQPKSEEMDATESTQIADPAMANRGT